MSKRLWVGLDVGLHQTSVCVLNFAGEPVQEVILPTSVETMHGFLRPLRRGNIEVIAMEAGSIGTYLARGLDRLKYSVAVLEARQISKYLGITQNKTDRNDARNIAEVARSGRGIISEVLIKSVECQRIRSMLATRQHFVRMRVGSEASIAAQFHLYGGKMPRNRSAAMLRRNAISEMTRIRKEQKIDLRPDIEPVLSICESLRAYIEHLDRKFAEMAASIEICRRFMELPGVGPIIALSFYSAICEPHRFERCKDVGPYLGLVPRVRQSGGTVARLRISKMGNTLTRQHLATAAMIILRTTTKDSKLRRWGLELRERRGMGRARMAVARKLAIIMVAMWKRGTTFAPFSDSEAVSNISIQTVA